MTAPLPSRSVKVISTAACPWLTLTDYSRSARHHRLYHSGVFIFIRDRCAIARHHNGPAPCRLALFGSPL